MYKKVMARKYLAPRVNSNGWCVTHKFCNISAISDVENEKEVMMLDGDNEAGSGREMEKKKQKQHRSEKEVIQASLSYTQRPKCHKGVSPRC